MELDYPRGKEQSKEMKAANEKLAQQYGVRGFPTVVFADASGKPFGGFVGGRSGDDVMKAMQDALKNKEALSAAEANVAKAATDEAKVAALMEVLKLAPQEYVDNFYGDVKAEIKKLDKEDKSGLKAADAHADLLKKEQKDVQNYLAGKLTDKTTPAEALQVVKAYPDRDKLLPETQQQLLMMEFGTYLNSTGDVDGAVLILDKVAELKPGTEAGMQAPRIKAGILANKDKIKAQIDAAKKGAEQITKAAFSFPLIWENGPATVFFRCGVFAFSLFLRLLKRDDGKEALWLMGGTLFSCGACFRRVLLRKW